MSGVMHGPNILRSTNDYAGGIMIRLGWGIWCLSTKTWVYDPEGDCAFRTQKEATADLKKWCLKERLKEYEVKKRTLPEDEEE